MKTIYIDDIVTSFDTELEAIQMREMIFNIFEGIGIKATSSYQIHQMCLHLFHEMTLNAKCHRSKAGSNDEQEI